MDLPKEGSDSNDDWALRYTKALSFPRKTGTEGDKKAGQTLVQVLEGLGYEVTEEPFSILVSPWVLMNGGSFLSFLSLLTLRLTYEKISWVAFLLSTLYLLGLGLWDRIWLRVGERMVSGDPDRGGIRTKNIYARFPGDQKAKPLYLITHYDSKSQSFNLYLRTGLLLLGVASGGLFCLWIWVQVFLRWMEIRIYSIPLIFVFSFFLSLATHLVLISSNLGNRSEGAVDNASGVGTLLAIARGWAFQKRRGLDLRFVFTGAEEMGLLGSLMFRKRWGQKMVLEKSSLINVDSIGKRGKMRVLSGGKAGKKWQRQILSIASEKKISLQPLRFYGGILMDHLPYCQLGIPSVGLTSISSEGWRLHTPRDTFSRVEPEGLVEMEEFILALTGPLATNGPGREKS